MKNQYFGDIKDLFKFDFIEWAIQRIPALGRFVYISMLTANDNRSHGSKLDCKGRAGAHNIELMNHLAKCVSEGRRDISEIVGYFDSQGIPVVICQQGVHLTHKTRGDYFAGIDQGLLEHSLILVDPDVGLEVKNSGAKHLLYEEAADLFERMSEDSILMIFQHFRHEKHSLTINNVSSQLEAACGQRPLWICDSEVVFFLLAKDPDMEQELAATVAEYRGRYPKLKAIDLGESDRVTATQLGAIAENLVATCLIIESGGRLSPFRPFADDRGIDLLVYDKVTGRALPIQIKSRTKTLNRFPKRVRFNVQRVTFNEDQDAYVLGVLIDPGEVAWSVKRAWLIPVSELPGVASQDSKLFKVTPSMDMSSRDKYSAYRCKSMAEVTSRLLNALND